MINKKDFEAYKNGTKLLPNTFAIGLRKEQPIQKIKLDSDTNATFASDYAGLVVKTIMGKTVIKDSNSTIDFEDEDIVIRTFVGSLIAINRVNRRNVKYITMN